MTRIVSIGPERLERWLAGFGERHGVTSYDVTPTQLTAVAEDGSRAEIDVPFGPLEELTPAGLVAHVLADRRIGLLLVRRGGYGAGVFAGGVLESSKVGSRHVQGTTKAGGWSQQRFARRRDNQAREAFAAATEVAVRILAPAKLDVLVCGGDRKAIDTVLEDPRLKNLVPLVRPPFLGVADPKQKVLEQAGVDARAIRIQLTDPPGG
ncbi:MAG TPA: acVLRF1 family peptidyl-tRNA hydrolase [Kribbella sp.]|uniref:acVLRF1 family peptidyl-tRNA hydrolase n=1 Tax=Kribbella sp. TaxID=1871183 RepID=UPI002D78F1CA|nr:acVLRF1 family peptidyl-tRNA hydrolase [Kribbella sp.]HET6292340.1 acVLRF1 family peptidyl-tRNA hydrolase [Kribbella sp.]